MFSVSPLKEIYFGGVKCDFDGEIGIGVIPELPGKTHKRLSNINAKMSMTLIPGKKGMLNLEKMLMINLPRKLKKKLLGTRRKRKKWLKGYSRLLEDVATFKNNFLDIHPL